MEEYLDTIYFKSAHPLSDNEQFQFRALFESEKGIEKAETSSDGILIEYSKYIFSDNTITGLLTKNGFIISVQKKRGFLFRQIQSLANNNKQEFGNRKPDCC